MYLHHGPRIGIGDRGLSMYILAYPQGCTVCGNPNHSAYNCPWRK